jgi:hypothetical protein
MNLKEIYLPDRYNYIAAFLTLDCNIKCAYCINSFGNMNLVKKLTMPGERWIAILDRLKCSENLPITLQGGEPSLHPDFVRIINNLRQDLKIDILTNLSFDVEEFINNVDPLRLKREAPYPTIRVTYHPDYMDLDQTIEKTIKIQKAGFSIGIYCIQFPWEEYRILEAKKKCNDAGILFKFKEFLGEYNGRIYGTYLNPEAIGNKKIKKCLCRTSEIIIGPNGDLFRCHHDLYKGFSRIGSLLDPELIIEDIFRECTQFGDCNPCDLKIKTNRFQIYGHSSVEIKDIGEIKQLVCQKACFDTVE